MPSCHRQRPLYLFAMQPGADVHDKVRAKLAHILAAHPTNVAITVFEARYHHYHP